MDKIYVDWFGRARKVITEIMENAQIADTIIQYNIFSAIFSCFEEKEGEQEQLKEYIEELLKTLFFNLDAEDIYDEKTWINFWGNTKDYNAFLEEYNFVYNLSLKDMGNNWLKKFDEMDEYDKIKKRELLRELAAYYAWNNAFFSVYAYQYWNENPNTCNFDMHRLSILQYWEYREIENYVEKINGLTIEEQIEKLTRLYCETEFDYRYPDRETLFLDMIEHDLMMPESLKMVKRIRMGRGITDSMTYKLRKVGYEENIIRELNKCKYLKSRSTAITKLLYIQNLL